MLSSLHIVAFETISTIRYYFDDTILFLTTRKKVSFTSSLDSSDLIFSSWLWSWEINTMHIGSYRARIIDLFSIAFDNSIPIYVFGYENCLIISVLRWIGQKTAWQGHLIEHYVVVDTSLKLQYSHNFLGILTVRQGDKLWKNHFQIVQNLLKS